MDTVTKVESFPLVVPKKSLKFVWKLKNTGSQEDLATLFNWSNFRCQILNSVELKSEICCAQGALFTRWVNFLLGCGWFK